MYPPKSSQQLQELHQRIISSNTTLHNKHCLVFYLLKDLSAQHHEATELAESFAKDVEGEVDTIADWMTQLLGHLPEIGQKVTYGPLTLEVTAVDRHRIDRLRVTKLPDNDQPITEISG